MKLSVLIEIMATALIVLWIHAAQSKLLAYPEFVAQLHMHPYLKHFAGLIARALPVLELAVAALLAIPGTRLSGLYSAAALLLVFKAYLTLMLLSDKNPPCSCGGIIGSLSWRQHVVFNLVFMLLAITDIITLQKNAIL